MNDALTKYIQTRSPDAFRQIVETQIDSVFSQCSRRLPDSAQAEDVTQTVFIALAHNAQTLPPDVILEGWLFTTTRFCCLNAQRAAARRANAEKRAAMARSEIIPSTAIDHAALSELEHFLDDAIARLSEADRNAILLRFFAGHSLFDVGRLTGTTEAAVKSRLCRAIRKLRTYFQVRGITADDAAITAALTITVKPATANLSQSIVTRSITSRPLARQFRLPRFTTIWPKLTAGLAASITVITAAVFMANGNALPDTPSAATTQSSLNQLTPLNTLKKLSDAIHNENRAAIADCLCGDDLDPDAAPAARAFFFCQAAEFRLRRAFLDKLKAEPELPRLMLYVFPNHTNFEMMFDGILSSPLTVAPKIDGDTARLHVPLSPSQFMNPNRALRKSALGHWGGSTLVFKQIDRDWKVDTDSTFNFDISVSRQPGNNETDLASMAKVYSVGADQFDEVSADIESGGITTVKQGLEAVRAGAQAAFKAAHVDYGSFMPLPLVGG